MQTREVPRQSRLLIRISTLFKTLSAPVFRVFKLRTLTAIALGLVLVAAIVVRLPGIDRPTQLRFSELYQDEYKTLTDIMKVQKGEPLLPILPYALYRWLQPQFIALLLVDSYQLSKIKGSSASFGDLHKLIKLNVDWYIKWLRYNALFFGLGLIFITFVLARQVSSDLPAVAAATLAALSPVLIAYSRTLYYDLPMAFWFWVTVAVLAWATRNRSVPGVYVAAALLGWTVATKQHGVALAPVWLGCSLYIVSGGVAKNLLRSVFSKTIILSGLLGLLVYILNYPTILSLRSIEQVLYITDNVLLGSQSLPLWILWPTMYWPGQAHISVLVILVIGMLSLPFVSRDRTTALVIVSAFLLFYLIIGMSTHARLRSIIPLVPALCIGIAGWFLLLNRWLARPVAYAIAGVITVFAATSLLLNAIRQNLSLTLPDTAELSAAWLVKNAKPMSKVGRETYTAHLPDLPPGDFLIDYARHKGIVPFDVTFIGSLGRQDADAYRKEGYDYLVASSRNRTIAEVAVAQGQEQTLQDIRALAMGSNPRFGNVPLSQVLQNYDSLEKNFEVAAEFTPNEPEEDRFLLNESPWWTLESFVPPGLWDLWVNHDRYILGLKQTIYRVK